MLQPDQYTILSHIPAQEQKNSTPERPTKVETCLTGTEGILIVDDDPLLVRINQTIDADYGYTVTGTTDNSEALAKMRAGPTQFDLLISDQTMPGLTGSEIARAVLEIAPDMGIKKFFYKPIQGDELARTVRLPLDETVVC